MQPVCVIRHHKSEITIKKEEASGMKFDSSDQLQVIIIPHSGPVRH